MGVVKSEYGDSFVIADIPGIIEGASEGTGLGLQFLRHIERTRLLLHVIDVSGSEGRNPVEDFKIINNELKKYSEKLSKRKQIIVANKIDSMQDKKIYELKDESQFTIYKEGKIFVVDGPAVQRVMRRVNVEDNESLHYFHKCLDDLGVNQALKKAGVQEGDTVRVVDWELEWYD